MEVAMNAAYAALSCIKKKKRKKEVKQEIEFAYTYS
jgi:hypothetical protein